MRGEARKEANILGQHKGIEFALLFVVGLRIGVCGRVGIVGGVHIARSKSGKGARGGRTRVGAIWWLWAQRNCAPTKLTPMAKYGLGDVEWRDV